MMTDYIIIYLFVGYVSSQVKVTYLK